MKCKYIFKSGKRKGLDCGKENCKTKLHLKKTNVKEEEEEGFKQVYKELDILDYAFLIKNELNYIIENKTPTNIIFKDKTIKRCNINEKMNVGFETMCYIMYSYKVLTGNNVDEFERIVTPVNLYPDLNKLLKTLTINEFLYKFSDIKSRL
jgi:hypothetical protein